MLASNAVFRFLEQNRASVQSMEADKERFARVRATTAVLSAGATCMFFLDQVDDRDKLRAIVLELAADLTG